MSDLEKDDTSKKRGRKRKNEIYFGPAEEDANNRYLESTDPLEKSRIFNEFLKDPLERMIELIIKKYKLYRKGYTLEEQCSDTLSFLITKVYKFEKGLGTKAYSYYGTICKNYNLGILIKDEKQLKQTLSMEDITEHLEEREDLTYTIEDDAPQMEEFIKNLIRGVNKEMDDTSQPIKKKLTENEIKVGHALIDLLENWEKAFDMINGGSKYNKNTVLETMRNYTNLSTKDIRVAMKRYKQMYDILKHKIL